MTGTTIIIPTYNRSGKLRETLDALALQRSMDFTVLVVDDGSDDTTAEMISACEKDLPYAVRYIKQENAGASAATNRGVAEAGSGLVILLDDDIIAPPEMVDQHRAFHSRYKNSILSGSAETDPKRTITDVQRYKLYMEEQWRKVRPAEDLLEVSFGNFNITTANMSFPFEIFQQTGGFDVSLRDGYDVDFGFRALQKEIPLYYNRNVRSIHNDQISLRYYAKRQKAYIDSRKKILERNPQLESLMETDMRMSVPFFKAIIYRMLKTSFFVDFFESKTFAKIFPQKIRYRVYGSTIAALSLLP